MADLVSSMPIGAPDRRVAVWLLRIGGLSEGHELCCYAGLPQLKNLPMSSQSPEREDTNMTRRTSTKIRRISILSAISRLATLNSLN